MPDRILTLSNGSRWKVTHGQTIIWVRDYQDRDFIGGVLRTTNPIKVTLIPTRDVTLDKVTVTHTEVLNEKV